MKKRRTRSEKIKADQKSGFKVNFGQIKQKDASIQNKADLSDTSHLKKDLTKVVLISMLAVGSELGLWWFVFK